MSTTTAGQKEMHYNGFNGNDFISTTPLLLHPADTCNLTSSILPDRTFMSVPNLFDSSSSSLFGFWIGSERFLGPKVQTDFWNAGF